MGGTRNTSNLLSNCAMGKFAEITVNDNPIICIETVIHLNANP